jgi:endonuclease YncB( thermonuclease family)
VVLPRTFFLIGLIGATAGILTLVASRTTIRAADFSGRVVGISDGDTISVMRDGRAEKVRLHGIDAPEKGQPFSNRAKRFVSDLVYTTWGWKHSSSRTAGALV